MRTLRRTLPTLAALLAVVVGVQTVDLVACADEAQATEHGESYADVAARAGHPTPVLGDSHHDHEPAAPDCLCHVVFTPTASAPALGARPALEPRELAGAFTAIPEVEPLGLDHVPLA